MTDKEWLYNTGQAEPQGPVSMTELAELASTGQLQPDDLIWKQGMEDWLPAGRVPQLGFTSQPSEHIAPTSQASDSQRLRSSKTAKARLPRWLVGAVVGIGCLLLGGCLLVVVAAWLRPPSSVAEDYTIHEMQRMITMLHQDPELRDSRGGPGSISGGISVELWERLFGKPIRVSGTERQPVWTYRTANGTMRFVIIYAGDGPDAGRFAARELGTHSLGPERTVDGEGLRAFILRMKKSLDPTDSLAKYQVYAAKQKAEEEKRQAEWEQDLNESSAADEEKALLSKDQFVALHEWDDLRPAGHTPAGKALLESQAEDWMDRRAAAITEARHAGEIVVERSWDGTPSYKGELPLPTAEQVAVAIINGDRLPVAPSEQVSHGEEQGGDLSDMGDSGDKVAGNSPEKPETQATETDTDAQPGDVAAAPSLRRVPIYRINLGKSYFYTTGTTQQVTNQMKGMGRWKVEGVIGYSLAEPNKSTVPLLRFVNEKGTVHRYMVPPHEDFPNFEADGDPLGWIWPADKTDVRGTVPLYFMGPKDSENYTLAGGEVERDLLLKRGWVQHRKLGYIYTEPSRVPLHRIIVGHNEDNRPSIVFAGSEAALRKQRGPEGDWLYAGVVGFVLDTEVGGAIPLMMHSHAGKHNTYTAGTPPDSGVKSSEMLGWISPEEQKGLVPVFLLENFMQDITVQTLAVGTVRRDRLEQDGWHQLKILGYAFESAIVSSK